MNYTINNKPYTLFDIKRRCAEIMGFAGFSIWKDKFIYLENLKEYDPCNNPSDTWPIIEKVWSKLNSFGKSSSMTQWERIIQQHNCPKLVAACICLIEMNEVK
jgi:hypothetical protein